MKRIVQALMIVSLGYYAVLLGLLWGGQALGLHNEVWEAFDLPKAAEAPPGWLTAFGVLSSAFLLGSLGIAYLAVSAILEGGSGQDFRNLGRRLRRLAFGLIGFWIGWNLISGAIPALLVNQLPVGSADIGWDPLDIDIVFPILGMALIAISQTMERAWAAEDETRHFL